jgi:hypothetical protein
MNPFTFEFTSRYLAKIAFESMTNKFFEMSSPVTDYDRATNKKKISNDIELVSVFQPESDIKNKLFHNCQYVKPEKNRKIDLDPTKITLWKEYFCRFDEGKKDKKE